MPVEGQLFPGAHPWCHTQARSSQPSRKWGGGETIQPKPGPQAGHVHQGFIFTI